MFQGRPQGVTIPESQRTGQDRVEPNQVLHIVPMQPVAIQFSDEYGALHSTMVYRVGKTIYIDDSNGERWAGSLKQAAPFIADAVNKELDAQQESSNVPVSDAVDVVASSGASSEEHQAPAK